MAVQVELRHVTWNIALAEAIGTCWADEWIGARAGAAWADEGGLLDGNLGRKGGGGSSRVRARDWVTTTLRWYVWRGMAHAPSNVAASVVVGTVATWCWARQHVELVVAHARIDARIVIAAAGGGAVRVLHLVQWRGSLRLVGRVFANVVEGAYDGTRDRQLDEVVDSLKVRKVSKFWVCLRNCVICGGPVPSFDEWGRSESR